MAKAINSHPKKRQSSLFFTVLYPIMVALPLALIQIGDIVILLARFITKLLLSVFSFFKQLGKNIRKMGRKIGRKMWRKKQKTVFSYHIYERKVVRQRSSKPIYMSLLTKIKYVVAGCIFSFIFIFLPLVAVIFIQDLPSPNDLSLRQIPQTTKIYDRNNTLLYQIYAQQNRTLVPLKEVPIALQHATISIEDKNFYSHPGFDIVSIARAAIEDLSGRPIQGGSTITQQLIKSSLLTPQQDFSRKFKEIILAFWAERLYTKQQILEMYFNQVPYGGTAWGIEAASEVYFSKSVKDVDLAQSAFLAGLTSSPTTYSPFGTNPNLWKKRQEEVLSRMVALNYITHKQAVDAAKEQLVFAPQQQPYLAPHFVNYVINWLENKYGAAMVERGGLTVRTSLDLNMQNMAQDVVKQEVANDQYLSISNGAAVITNPQNGDILAMVGSHDFNDPTSGNVNLATSLRQPGSSIKVVTYTASLQHGFTAATTIDDSPTNFSNPWETYTPVNYDNKFHGRVTLRTALANSFNIPAVKVLNQVGIPTMVDLGKNMGIQHWGDPSQYGLSITLGSAEVTMLDMASVYGTLANQGNKVDINPIDKVTDYKGNVIEQKADTVSSTQVIDPGITYIMSDILADNSARSLEFGPNSPLNIPGHYVSVKTGTTDNKRDNWTDGYTRNFVVVTWVGNNNNVPMSQSLASGITGAAPIWNKIMSNLIKNESDPQPNPPNDIVQKNCMGRNDYFLRGTENTVPCQSSQPSDTPEQRH